MAVSERWDEPLARLLGKRAAGPLAALGLHTTGDLLRHYPRRYASPGRLTDLTSLVPGEHVTVMAEVRQATVRTMRSRGGVLLQAVVTDGLRELSLTFFGKHPGSLRVHESRLRPGRQGMFTGTVTVYRGSLQLTHPDYQLVGTDVDDEAAALVEASRPIPVYPASAALPTWRIQRAVRTVLDPMTEADVPDPLPDEVRARRRLPTLLEALRLVHEPYSDDDASRGRRRLRFEEAFVLQAALARRRAEAAARPGTARPAADGGLRDAFDRRLPFALTAGQRAVGEEISADLSSAEPMQRLLQGEVGSGKTVVALRAMLQVVDAGGQAALLAPTEVLAAQHLRTLRDLLGPLAEEGMLGAADRATRVVLLTGSQTAAARREALLDAASGAAGIVVGTHALLGERVQFADLGLVVVDEQHRFGVEQRDVLRSRGGDDARVPHLLVMTATPIPRTVAMTVFGDLEVSTLTEIPSGRSPVRTHVVPADNQAWLERTWARVREEVDAGRRAYVVCPRISADGDGDGGSGDDDADLLARDAVGETDARPPLRAVEEVAAELAAHPALAGVPVGVLHGRMAPAAKDEAMSAFATGRTPVLVCTTVIEVGVDVPEASAMVVLDAERFGLSQLHQLRGRVGRGREPGLCLLVARAAEGSDAAVRLETLASTTDGFALAAVDLELRREGDVLGASQSGRSSSLRLLRVVRDAELIAEARDEARTLVAEDPGLREWPALAAAIDAWLAPDAQEYLDRA
ncbi:ATP-dependent DNA helicase RecG [Actinotalea sp. M2MS4P-6]|uniref:ATP-dependent DNA helicase RecG n=1 Tax=Actinotalea sp. M2MS4P-6 TaxID=2983762 RepID=UPI0021E38857|nr:ATP-dependent DNA helicase RecG [Actinotalea sp. M2MS4P-6]MCV2393986.1 ATP-dependent DNA helicase RecG [Actinotalea sp. M2MS4P-6]